MSAELFRLVRNQRALRAGYPGSLDEVLSAAHHDQARAIVSEWTDYDRTPLLELNSLARHLGVDAVWAKNEGERFGLGAFKALGGAYAVYRALERIIHAQRPNAEVSPAALQQGDYADITGQVTIACASAGNHGRAVAWGARRFGANCVVYLYQSVSPGRAAAIEELGARVDRSALDYDTAVRRVAEDAAVHGWQIVSDTAYSGYTEVPRDVMQGYTVIAAEVIDQLNGDLPTHVLLQAGVGGFAAAIAAHFWQCFGAARPILISVEPSGATCVLESIARGRRHNLDQVSSIMGGLCCGQVSLTAWEVLRQAIDIAVAIPDVCVPPVMRALRHPAPGDPEITAGESGAAGMAALRWLALDPEAREEAGLDHNSRVLTFITEGATDPRRYAELMMLAGLT